MADVVANIAKGRILHYAGLSAASDGLVAIPLEAAGLPSDDVLQDYDTVADLLAGPANEQTVMGRVALTGVVVSVNDTANSASFDANDMSWLLATGAPTGKLVIAYDPDTTAGTDAALIPLTYHDFAVIPDGTDIVARVHTDGISVDSNA
ncbi:hypothetical protein UK15_07690 [Streptomyces variegatus]|uniref:Uncharacterized protein n=1 Tax=Streptomyces variegatus TaxID=284040 RepID=A0A0M2GVR3_9ACTN|nr:MULTISPECIES: hypothetical protein [Streptomyces]KJK40225.1 hypothetical protein UK15_07690 [Streptomyces variegatus]